MLNFEVKSKHPLGCGWSGLRRRFAHNDMVVGCGFEGFRVGTGGLFERCTNLVGVKFVCVFLSPVRFMLGGRG